MLSDDYEITKDIELNGKIKTVLKCEKAFLISKILYNSSSTVTIPNICLSVREIEGNQLLEYRKCKIYDSLYELYYDRDFEQIPTTTTSILENADVENLIVYADSFFWGISSNTFADNDKIKSITIKGSINFIRTQAFYNLSKLEKVVIEGLYLTYWHDPIVNCPISIYDIEATNIINK